MKKLKISCAKQGHRDKDHITRQQTKELDSSTYA
jgi:hypothetical protein